MAKEVQHFAFGNYFFRKFFEFFTFYNGGFGNGGGCGGMCINDCGVFFCGLFVFEGFFDTIKNNKIIIMNKKFEESIDLFIHLYELHSNIYYQ